MSELRTPAHWKNGSRGMSGMQSPAFLLRGSQRELLIHSIEKAFFDRKGAFFFASLEKVLGKFICFLEKRIVKKYNMCRIYLIHLSAAAVCSV